MSVFIDALSGLCKDHVLTEKWLISPNHRVGSQIIEQIAASGQSLVNCHVKTIENIAKDIVDDSRVNSNLLHMQSFHRELLMGELFHRLREKGKGYLSGLKPGSGLFSHLLSAIDELRKAGITSTQLDVHLFEEPVKGREMLFLLESYENELKSHNLIDYPGALMIAVESINTGVYKLDDDILIIAPKDVVTYDFCPMERNLLKAFPPSQTKILPYDDPENNPGAAKTDLSLLTFIINPFKAPMPKKDNTIVFYKAHGLVNEVKDVFRRILYKKIPFDKVEIIHTDTGTYIPLIFETAYQFKPEHITDIPVTFAEGIPITYSRPGKALKAWMSWISSDFPQSLLRRMIQDGLLDIGGTGENKVSFSRMAKLFRKAKIGKGRKRYKRVLPGYLAGLKRQVSHMVQSEDEDPRVFLERKNEKENNCILLDEMIKSVFLLIDNAPASTDPPHVIIDKMLWFLTTMVRSSGEFNNYAADKLKSEIGNLRNKTIPEENLKFFDPWEWLSSFLYKMMIMGEGPRPGHIFISNMTSGGYSGRDHTFFLGLDDSRFPGSGFYDPILLDKERSSLSDDIPRMADMPWKKMADLQRFFSRLKGSLTMSYSSLDIPGNRELFPSSAMLSAFRIATGLHEADYEELEKKLSPSVSFTPESGDLASTIDEWWLSTLCGKQKVSDPEKHITGTYENLKTGLIAKKNRESDRFTEFDGYLPVQAVTLNPYHEQGPVLSANRLQLCAKSPMDYFFRYVLDIEPPEDEEVDVNVWLDPMTRGSVLHAVFEEFMRNLRDDGTLPPVYKRDKKQIHSILKSKIEEIKEEYPPFQDYACKKDCFLLEKAVDIFLIREEEFCKKSTPVFFEVPVGLPFSHQDENSNKGIASKDPASLKLSKEKTIRVRARIDRIDKCRRNSGSFYSVWDYKTGSSTLYDESDPFNKGRIVQNILYLLITENRLTKIEYAARVMEVGYFFTSMAELGKRISWYSDRLMQGVEYLEKLADLIAAGCFPCSVDPKDLAYTDYADAMIDADQARREMVIKMDNPANTLLDHMRALRL
ncbi:MAG: PD-(D/E)XK nuclease family protein [Spirochaetales bacterium]|nr:PD-(D/E)XK nuclease family protein [Spirochaetales bacterium]